MKFKRTVLYCSSFFSKRIYVSIYNYLRKGDAMRDVYRKGYVYIQGYLAGIIEETKGGYRFTYDSQYLSSPLAKAISLSLPLRKKIF